MEYEKFDLENRFLKFELMYLDVCNFLRGTIVK